jgi:hypothetical protein
MKIKVTGKERNTGRVMPLFSTYNFLFYSLSPCFKAYYSTVSSIVRMRFVYYYVVLSGLLFMDCKALGMRELPLKPQ